MGRTGISKGAGVDKAPTRDQAPPPPVVARASLTELATVEAAVCPDHNKHSPDHLDYSDAGVAARLRRDTVVILRLDGEDLEDFASGPEFQEVVDAAYPLLGPDASLRDRVRAAIGMLTVDHGMPPASDKLVVEDVVEPAMGFVSAEMLEQPVSLEGFAIVFRKIVEGLAQSLKDRPVIVACCDDAYDGSEVNRLLSENRDLDKLLNSAWRTVAKVKDQLTPKEFLNNVLNKIFVFAGLPPIGTVSQLDAIINEAYREVNRGDSIVGNKEGFENMIKGILRNIMYRLEKNSISVSSTTVINEQSGQQVC